MATRAVEAVFDKGEVRVLSKEDANMLFQSGYGSLNDDNSTTLSRCESLYLVAEHRLNLVEGTSKIEVEFKSLLEKFRTDDPKVWTKYLVFRDLRSRGYVVKDGFGWGIDFRVYERGTYLEKAAKYIVFAISEGVPIRTNILGEIIRMAHGIKKELIVAVIDRRGDIVYYSLKEFLLNAGSKSGE